MVKDSGAGLRLGDPALGELPQLFLGHFARVGIEPLAEHVARLVDRLGVWPLLVVS